MVKDLVIDTDILVVLLTQFFSKTFEDNGGLFIVDSLVTKPMCDEINKIVKRYYNGEPAENLVITSSFSFVEVARQFDKLSAGTYNEEKFKAFIEQNPEWLSIEPLDKNLFEYFFLIPESVVNNKGELLNIEWADAIHIATYYTRDNALMLTSDSKLKALKDVEFL